MRSRVGILFLLFTYASIMFAQTARTKGEPGRDYGRSMVVNRLGIVATSQTLASAAGAEILSQGGSAVDAASAANAVLGVTEPMMNGIGGDLFAIVYDAKAKKLYGLNSSGWAPQALTIEFLRANGITTKSTPRKSIHSLTVPGAVAGWDALHNKFGKLPLDRVLQPAIYYAKNGAPIAEMVSQVWESAAQLLQSQPGFRETFLPEGHAPKTGEVFRDAALASSLELIAAHGRDGFYRGPVAQKIVQFSKSQGGTMTEQDLAEFRPEWVDPISTTYRGWTVSELPPNGQGIAALSMLNIMEQFPLSRYGHNSARVLHVMIEAKKLAYADLIQYVGDPRFTQVPVEQLLSKDLARKRADSIDPNRAHCSVLPSELSQKLNAMGKDTTYLTVIDQDGNIVSLIQSNYSSFGTGLVAPGTGFALQNRGQLFTLETGKPNSLAPHKRPLHTIIPGMLVKDGQAVMPFGVMGGHYQAVGHAHFIHRLLDRGMDPQQAAEQPRILPLNGVLQVERANPEPIIADLAHRGHEILMIDVPLGGCQAIWMDHQRGVLVGGSEPRKDGLALGY